MNDAQPSFCARASGLFYANYFAPSFANAINAVSVPCNLLRYWLRTWAICCGVMWAVTF